MKTVLIIFSFLFFLPADVSAGWKVGDVQLNVVPCPDHGCYISKVCLEKQKNCMALKAYKNPVKGKVGNGGANPGSLVCKEKLKGKVNIAVDEEGNQEGFCVFEDGSMISLAGVWK